MQRLIRWGQPVVNNVVRPGDPIVWRKPAVTAPIFIDPIPDLDLIQNVEMTPFDTSVHFKRATSYAITMLNPGLTFDEEFGIIKGTPTAVGAANPFVTGSNVYGSAQSNVFNILVSAPTTTPPPVTTPPPP